MEPNAQNYNLSLGDREAFLVRALAQERKPIFSTADAARLLGGDARQVLHRLARKRWLLPLTRGLYALVPLDVGVSGADVFTLHSFTTASLLVEPYYIGFWSALNYHGLTEQIPLTTFIATTHSKHPVTVLSQECRFVKLSPRKFFGWQEVEIDGHPVRVSDPEKTLADCLDHPQHCGGIEPVARALYLSHDEMEMAKVVSYAERMGNRSILKRLGFILEQTGLLEGYARLLPGSAPSAGFTKLDPLSRASGRHDTRWGLLVNYHLDPGEWGY
ncbi:MAG: type IV toxin-antitoxin system AbiEi family antitoxin [Armatimonadota bacterium]